MEPVEGKYTPTPRIDPENLWVVAVFGHGENPDGIAV